MHGDDVASVGVEISAKVALQTTEILFDFLKIAIEKEREDKHLRQLKQSEVVSGGEVTYQRLKEGGEVTMLSSFAKEDYVQLLKNAKKLNIPVMAIQEHGKENTLSVFFNVKDKEAVNSIVQDIVREKMNQPEQSERMITIEKAQVEGFQMYCSDHDIPVNFMESHGVVKCIFSVAYEKQIETAAENYKEIRNELSKIAVDVKKDDNGKLKIVVNDNLQRKSLAMNFCTKTKLERVLKERLEYNSVKAVETANILASKLSDEQLKYFLSGSRQLDQMAYYKNNIRFENENVLMNKFSFAKMQFQGESAPRLTITDEANNFVVLSANSLNRAETERNIRQYLKVEDEETITAILSKVERLGFTEAPND